jgi:predicted kinase
VAGALGASTPRAPTRTLVCVGGAPGAGKTTVGSLVAAAEGLCLVDLDSVTTPLVEAFAAALGVVANLDAPRFAALREARYSCLAAVASDNLRAGRDVVAVAPFTTEALDASSWRAQGARWGAERVVLCWLDVDPAESARRAAARGLPRDLAKGRDLAAGRREGSDGGGRPASAEIDRVALDVVVDGGRDPSASVFAIVAMLRTGTMPG